MDYLDEVKKRAGDCSVFRDYRFESFIGRGGYGRVYEAFCHLYQCKYAIKIYSKSNKTNSRSNLVQRNEADILKRLKHDNVIKIFEYIETKFYIFVVTELCMAGDLWKVLSSYQKFHKTKGMTEKLVSQILHQLIDGLVYLKQSSIIHRDIKPGKND